MHEKQQNVFLLKKKFIIIYTYNNVIIDKKNLIEIFSERKNIIVEFYIKTFSTLKLDNSYL